MKSIVSFVCLLLCPISCFSQRYRSERSYDIIGLANGDEISDCLEKGLPFFLIGLAILLICVANIRQEEKEGRENKGSWWGCFSFILIGIGAIIMLPLLAWIEAVVVSIVGVLTVGVILYCIWEWVTK